MRWVFGVRRLKRNKPALPQRPATFVTFITPNTERMTPNVLLHDPLQVFVKGLAKDALLGDDGIN